MDFFSSDGNGVTGGDDVMVGPKLYGFGEAVFLLVWGLLQGVWRVVWGGLSVTTSVFDAVVLAYRRQVDAHGEVWGRRNGGAAEHDGSCDSSGTDLLLDVLEDELQTGETLEFYEKCREMVVFLLLFLFLYAVMYHAVCALARIDSSLLLFLRRDVDRGMASLREDGLLLAREGPAGPWTAAASRPKNYRNERTQNHGPKAAHVGAVVGTHAHRRRDDVLQSGVWADARRRLDKKRVALQHKYTDHRARRLHALGVSPVRAALLAAWKSLVGRVASVDVVPVEALASDLSLASLRSVASVDSLDNTDWVPEAAHGGSHPSAWALCKNVVVAVVHGVVVTVVALWRKLVDKLWKVVCAPPILQSCGDDLGPVLWVTIAGLTLAWCMIFIVPFAPIASGVFTLPYVRDVRWSFLWNWITPDLLMGVCVKLYTVTAVFFSFVVPMAFIFLYVPPMVDSAGLSARTYVVGVVGTAALGTGWFIGSVLFPWFGGSSIDMWWVFRSGITLCCVIVGCVIHLVAVPRGLCIIVLVAESFLGFRHEIKGSPCNPVGEGTGVEADNGRSLSTLSPVTIGMELDLDDSVVGRGHRGSGHSVGSRSRLSRIKSAVNMSASTTMRTSQERRDGGEVCGRQRTGILRRLLASFSVNTTAFELSSDSIGLSRVSANAGGRRGDSILSDSDMSGLPPLRKRYLAKLDRGGSPLSPIVPVASRGLEGTCDITKDPLDATNSASGSHVAEASFLRRSAMSPIDGVPREDESRGTKGASGEPSVGQVGDHSPVQFAGPASGGLLRKSRPRCVTEGSVAPTSWSWSSLLAFNFGSLCVLAVWALITILLVVRVLMSLVDISQLAFIQQYMFVTQVLSDSSWMWVRFLGECMAYLGASLRGQFGGIGTRSDGDRVDGDAWVAGVQPPGSAQPRPWWDVEPVDHSDGVEIGSWHVVVSQFVDQHVQIVAPLVDFVLVLAVALSSIVGLWCLPSRQAGSERSTVLAMRMVEAVLWLIGVVHGMFRVVYVILNGTLLGIVVGRTKRWLKRNAAHVARKGMGTATSDHDDGANVEDVSVGRDPADSPAPRTVDTTDGTDTGASWVVGDSSHWNDGFAPMSGRATPVDQSLRRRSTSDHVVHYDTYIAPTGDREYGESETAAMPASLRQAPANDSSKTDSTHSSLDGSGLPDAGEVAKHVSRAVSLLLVTSTVVLVLAVSLPTFATGIGLMTLSFPPAFAYLDVFSSLPPVVRLSFPVLFILALAYNYSVEALHSARAIVTVRKTLRRVSTLIRDKIIL